MSQQPQASAGQPMPYRSNPWAILWGGLAAGSLDLTFAVIYYPLLGSTPLKVVQSIASGLLGRTAFDGGWRTGLLGLALQYVIATGACAAYWLASRKLATLTARPVFWGSLFGVAVYFFMKLVVLPLSAIPWHVTFEPTVVPWELAAHILFVGLPIALIVRAGAPAVGARPSTTAA
jgi:hypothetical protein